MTHPSLDHAEHLLNQRRLAEAYEAFNQAEQTGGDPDRCTGGRWLIAMLHGDFAAAWAESDALRRRNAPDPHRMWEGRSLAGRRVIVRCLHGFGDTVQMLQYAPALRSLAASVVYEVAPRFLPLAPFFRGVNEVVTWGEEAPPKPPAWDIQIELMELPYIFRTMQRDLPLQQNYLCLPPVVLDEAAARMPPPRKRRIGLVSTAADWNPSRSIGPYLLSPLLPVSGVEFWSLEPTPPQQSGMIDASAVSGHGLLSLAATIAHLDLVITVDTLGAHLAGALGKPVWLMLQYAADWRWMSAREDSPWYPTMRIFRQETPGDWPGVVESVRRALPEWMALRS